MIDMIDQNLIWDSLGFLLMNEAQELGDKMIILVILKKGTEIVGMFLDGEHT